LSTLIKEYEAKLDIKKRFTLRGAKFNYYKVKVYSDGHIELEPRVLVPTDNISKKTLSMMDKSIKNLKDKKVSDPIDFEKYIEN
jgi:hypothetical protein